MGDCTKTRVYLKNETNYLKKYIDETEFYTLDFPNPSGNSCLYNCIIRGIYQLFQVTMTDKDIRHQLHTMLYSMPDAFFVEILHQEYTHYRSSHILNTSLQTGFKKEEWQYQILMHLANRDIADNLKAQLKILANKLIKNTRSPLNVDLITKFFNAEKLAKYFC